MEANKRLEINQDKTIAEINQQVHVGNKAYFKYKLKVKDQ